MQQRATPLSIGVENYQPGWNGCGMTKITSISICSKNMTKHLAVLFFIPLSVNTGNIYF